MSLLAVALWTTLVSGQTPQRESFRTEISLDGLPNILHVGETRHLVVGVTVAVPADAPVDSSELACEVHCSLPDESRALTLARRQPFPPLRQAPPVMVYEAKALFPVRIDSIPSAPIAFHVVVTNSSAGELGRSKAAIVPVQAASPGVSVRDGRFVDDENRRVFLLATEERWQERRQWAPLKFARRWHYRRTAAPVLVGDFPVSIGVNEVTPFWRLIPGLVYDDLAMAGPEGVSSVLWLPINLGTMLAGTESRSFLLSLPPDDVRARLPAEDVVRSFAAAAMAIRERRPGATISLVTPLPMPGEDELSAAYAAVVREAARQCKAELLDLHASVRGAPSWENLFSDDHFVHSATMGDIGQALVANCVGDHVGRSALVDNPPWPSTGSEDPAASVVALVSGEADEADTMLAWGDDAPGDLVNWHAVDCTVEADTAVDGRESAERSLKSGLIVRPEFPGESAVWRELDFDDGVWTSASFELFVPRHSPRDLKVGFCVKDKDGLWFQATASAGLASDS